MNTVASPDGTTIAYDQSGEGPPVILVGAAFNDRQTTAPLAAALAPHFTAVRRPGGSRRSRCPTLAIASTGSPGWLQCGAKAVADTVPAAQHRNLDGGFHEIPPELLAPVLNSFFTT